MLKDQITILIAESMKAHNTFRTGTLRLIKAELMKAEIANRTAYDKQVETKTLLKMVSTHKDSIEQYIAGGRPDLAEKEQLELNIIQEFAPREVSEEEIVNYTKMLIELRQQDVPVSMKDMRDILFGVQETYPTATGKLVSSVLKEYIK